MTPDEILEELRRVAGNYRWTWDRHAVRVLASLPTAEAGRHPLEAIDRLDADQVAALGADDTFMGALGVAIAVVDDIDVASDPEIAYFSPEFGVSETLPQYSGGLGILAGDHLKAASDLGVRLAGIGLFYRHGFFRQEIVDGGQGERIETHHAEHLGAVDTGVVVEVPMPGRTVLARVWRISVGSVPLIVLDCDVDGNAPDDRAITDRLYSGDRLHRLEQEMVLGVGGARAVAALGWSPGVHHLNEGHAGFLLLELIDREISAGASLADALDRVRSRVLFTTHTPVPAGIDRFERGLIEPHLRPWADRWGVDIGEVLALGDDPDAGSDVFNMAVLCLGGSARANGVSALHGEVSRDLFASVPGGDRIGSITNGVHARTWVSDHLQGVFDEMLGPGWDRGDEQAWASINGLSADAMRSQRRATRSDLVELVARRCGTTIEPDSLVIGFARRFATYKRADLLLRHPERLAELLADDDRPIHLVFAGKAHPADGPGKALLASIVAHGSTPEANGRFTFLPDYDMGVARAMYHGCDVWLNTPVRPHEASGTSGEKAALNGALNCSIRDGWWAEMSDGANGFDIALHDPEGGFGAVEDAERDLVESSNTLDRITEMAAEFHADRTGDASMAWVNRMVHAWRTLGPRVTAGRMVADYDRDLYRPMLTAD
ncbi:MAG: alpha-glucan family phosphorylase [Ilumatobacteraceae bacterium]